MISKIVNAGMGIGQHDWTSQKFDVFMGIAAMKWDVWPGTNWEVPPITSDDGL